MSSSQVVFANPLATDWRDPVTGSAQQSIERDPDSNGTLAASITRAASKQTYYTIRLLVDRERVADAYRAYAYFRWVDDWLDQGVSEKAEALTFLERQQAVVACAFGGAALCALMPQERMLVDLVRSNPESARGLQAYVQHMMAVMAFDAERRGRLISQQELDNYTRHLATAVTEALHYFIGHGQFSPCGEARYLAVSGAHITHMLRDTFEDAAAGYFNIPIEYLESRGIDPQAINSNAYRAWVKGRVALARDCFEAGGRYLAQVENSRCRLAGYAYTARFEVVLDAIEREGYLLRPDYPERKHLSAGLRMGWSAIRQTLLGASVRAGLPDESWA